MKNPRAKSDNTNQYLFWRTITVDKTPFPILDVRVDDVTLEHLAYAEFME